MENRQRFIRQAHQLSRLSNHKNISYKTFEAGVVIHFKKADNNSIKENTFHYLNDMEFVSNLIGLSNAKEVDPIQEYSDKLLGELGIDPNNDFSIEII